MASLLTGTTIAANIALHAGNVATYALPIGGGTLASTSDQILTLNKSSGTGWGYIGFSQAGTRRFYFGLNGSFEPELGVDNGGTFRVVGGMTVAGNAVLTSTSTLTAGNLSGTIPSGVLGNSTHYIGTTAITLNRASASQNLTGVSIDGNAATVGSVSKVQLFNNTGLTHGAYTTFAALPNFGFYFMQGQNVADAPPAQAANQYYVVSMGLGDNYSYSQYAKQIALPRISIGGGNNYLWIREKENSTWGSWGKVYAGYADTAGNASTVTTNANLTGHITSVGNATSLGSFTSAQLLAALTDETGTGANVFATSPTLVTPILGTPSSGNLANCTFPTLNQNTTGNAATATNVAWSGITSKPTTLSGFGITDAASINGASNQNFSAHAIHPYEWIRFMATTGIYWQSGSYAGWHIHPQALWGMSFRSASTDCGLQLRRSNDVILGSLYSDGTSIGFLDASNGWGASFTIAGAMNRGSVPGSLVTGNISGSAGSVAWSGITSKPTTVSGFGITDTIPLLAAVAEANLDTATATGFRLVAKTGHSSTLLTINAGGSTGPFQLDANYFGLLRWRNQIDSGAANWTAWKTLIHDGNYTSYPDATKLPLTGGTLTGLLTASSNATIYRDLIVNGGASGNFGNRIIVGTTATTYTLQDGNLRPTVYLNGEYPVLTLNNTATSNANHGPTIQFAFNGLATGGATGRQILIGANGVGSWLDFGFSGGANGDNSNYNPHNGISGYGGTTAMRLFSNGLLVGSTGTYPNHITSTSYALDVRGTGYFSSTLQATRINFGATGAAPYATAAGEGTGNGITFGGDEAGHHYRIFTGMENIGGNHSKLTFNWHTGIRLGAYTGYGGIRFYNNSVGSGTEIFSVGNGDNNVRVVNTLYIGGNTALHAGNYNSYALPLSGGTLTGALNGTTGAFSGAISGTELTLSGQGISAYNLLKYGGIRTSGDWQTFTNTQGQINIIEVHNITGGGYTNNPTGVYTYGAVMSWRTSNHSFQLYAAHTGDLAYKTQWGNDNYSGWRRILDSASYPYAAAMNQNVGTGNSPTFADLSITGQYQIRNANPTITFRDTDHRTGYIHVNANIFHILTGPTDSAYGGWSQVANSRWPLEINLSNNNATFGGDVNAISFTGAGTGLTGTASSLSIGGNAATATSAASASSLAANTNTVFKVIRFTGEGYDSGNGAYPTNYGIYQQGGSWTHPYPDLCIGFHTGIKIGAQTGYGGIRFYNTETWGTEIFSVGNGDNNVRVVNTIYAAAFSGPLTGNVTGNLTGLASSATTAGNVNGYSTSTGVGANTIVVRDASGYIYAHYINTNVSESENPTVNSFFTSNGDGWLRKSTVAHVKYTLSLSGTNTGDQTNISGNAGSVTDGVYLSTNQSIGGVKTFSSAPIATNIAKAWVHYNKSTTTISASYNVSSVTSNGTGVFTVNFTNAMVDTNYVVAGTATYGYDDQDIYGMVLTVPRRSTAQQAGSCRLATEFIHAAQIYDCVAVRAVFYR